MEDLILEYGSRELKIEHFDNDALLPLTVQIPNKDDAYLWLTPSQTRELIAHLTNCLKEVEGEQECDHPFASVMSKCNGEINHCLKCGEKF